MNETEPQKSFVVSPALAGERIDRAVALVTGSSRADVAKMVEAGAIAVNRRVVTVRHHRIDADDVVEITEIPRPDVVTQPAPDITFDVVYEDRDIIVVDKPAGLVVHAGAGHDDDTLVAGLLTRYPDLATAQARGAGDAGRPGIVHRLDKDTSGLLVVARTPEAYRSLVDQLAARTVGREYRALAVGSFDSDAGTIDAPIGRSTRARTLMAVQASGRAARTHYRVRRRYDRPVALTLLELSLETGRTHQIRVHLRAIGHPVAGDVRYGGHVRALALGRPFLHAARLELSHPSSGAPMTWETPLPQALSSCLEALEAASLAQERAEPGGERPRDL